MKFNSVTVGRIVRGVIGVPLVITSIINASWIGIPGVLLLFSAISGRCGFGSTSCEIETDTPSEEKQ
jgi:hypothetical protein